MVRFTIFWSYFTVSPAWEFILSVLDSLFSLGIGSISLVCVPNVGIGNEGKTVTLNLLAV